MKAKLIVNPVSGKDEAPDALVALNERLHAIASELDIVMTVAPGDAWAASARAVAEGCEHLFVAGGDGTLNEVVNGAAHVPGGLARVTFGLLPLGTGNDFARGLGLPEDLSRALDVLARGSVVEVDLGVLGDRCFVNVSAGGFIADVSDAASSGLKSVVGRLAYLIGGAEVLLDHQPIRINVRADEREAIDGEVSLFAVCNSRLVGGGRLIAPFAILDDGLLDVCVIRHMSTLDLVRLLTRVASGAHLDDERVSYFRARTVEISSPTPFRVNTDGEVLEGSSCRYSVMPRAARFFADEAPFTLGATSTADELARPALEEDLRAAGLGCGH
jgi:diacylglycerol kinase (ATP)